jgi:hypothetical protein
MTMQIPATTLADEPLGLVELLRGADGRARVNGQPVLAIRPLGSRIALIVGDRQYCVALTDYWRVMRAATATEADDEGA